MIGIILAAGKGKRMNSDLPKVLHKINGISMIERIIRQMQKTNIKKIYIIVNDQNIDIIKSHLYQYTGLNYVLQKVARGTGDALMAFCDNFFQDETLFICCGDMPLLSSDIFDRMQKQSPFCVCAFQKKNPHGYGRIITEGDIIKIIEDKDCNNLQKQVELCNSGMYILPSISLKKVLPFLKNENQQQEFYLTDTIQLLQEQEKLNCNILILDYNESFIVEGVNSIKELENINSIFNPKFVLLHENIQFLQQVPDILSELSNCEYDESLFLSRIYELQSNKNIKIYIAHHELIGIYAIGSLYLLPKFTYNCSNVGQIEDIVIHKHLRNEKIGSLLIQHLIKEARSCNCYKVILNAEEKNFKFYEKLGFTNKCSQFEIRF